MATKKGPSKRAPPRKKPPSRKAGGKEDGAPPPSAGQRLVIVGMGASAGGLAAFEQFFAALPAEMDVDMAFVLVQHLSPDHKSILVELIGRYTKMKVLEVEDGMVVEPSHVYIIPPNREMSLEGGMLRLFPPSEPRGQRLPIDFFFRSLAREQRERAICLVLSGTGSDGTLGARAVKGEGGMVMAQDPGTTEHDGMPRSAITTGLVDYVLSPQDMPDQLIAYVQHALAKAAAAPTQAPTTEGLLRRLTSILRAQTGHDFSQYKSTTLLRRMERRMALHQIVSPDDYFEYARENPAEVEGLFRDLLIGVTNFFRDPEAFKALEEKVIARLVKAKNPHDQLRVWVCGCSTGEEAYSLAILIHEHLEEAKTPLKVQVFATDIDHLAIEQARAGVFPASIAADISANRLSRFFTPQPESGTYRVQKVIRDMLVFSEQDVIRDPPFSKLDLITCRNLLIYLNGEMQRRLIPLFHYALAPGGVLFLGTSETVGEFGRLFTPIDRKWRIYAREDVEPQPARLSLTDFMPPFTGTGERRRTSAPGGATDPVTSWRQLTEQALLAHHGDSGVLINSRGDILHILGKTGKYLEPAAGDATMNILAMARDGLRRELTSALHKAVVHKQPTHHKGLRVKADGDYVTVDLTVRPVDVGGGGSSDLYLIVLEGGLSAPERTAAAGDATSPESADRIAQLEQELKIKEDYLQTTLEEMETTNEELKSTNEEMQSVNEELQSTNEELETSKEELQSVNEELSTVNAELQDKLADLSRVNNDMNNLLAGTGIGTVFVDNLLRILRFTPSATQVINLIPADLGRPVEHIVSNLVGYPDLVADIHKVLDTLMPKEAEVRTRAGVSYLMRIRPYRTSESTIEGAVLTFVDIRERKRAEAALRKSEERFHAIFNQAFAGVTEIDASGRFIFVNDRFCDMTGFTRRDLLEMTMEDLTHPDEKARTNVLLQALTAGGPDFSIEKRYRRRDGSHVWVTDRVSGVRDADGKVTSAVAISFDLTDRKRLEEEATTVDARLASELNALSRLEGMGSLTLSANPDAVYAEILDTAIAVTQAQMGTLQVLTDGGQPPALRIVAARGLSRDYVKAWDEAFHADGNWTNALRAGERIVVEDVTQSPLLVGTPALDVQLRAGVRALQSVPLLARDGGVLGILTTHFRVPNRPEPRRLHMFDILARQASGIIERDGADGHRE